MNHLFIVTHTDLDGVGSAAAYVRLAGVEKDYYTIVFAEPYNLDEALSGLKDYVGSGDRLVLADLGPNKLVFEEVVNLMKHFIDNGVEVEWYDHHIWDPSEEREIKSLGVKLYIDTSTCATGVVVKYFPHERRDESGFTERLAKAVCAADLWRWDDPLAPKLFRVAGNRRDEDWKRRLVDKLSSGILWDDELQAKLEEYVNRELEGMHKALKNLVVRGSRSDCLVAATIKDEGPPSSSFVGALMLSRYGADIAVIARPNGALSLRSRSVNVQVVAKRLGGGGHPRAAGAKISVPLWVRIASIIYRKALSRYIAGLVRSKALEEGVCRPHS